MPLQLGDVSTARPQLVTWNPSVYDEAQEARQRIAQLQADGFVVDHEEDGEVRLRPPSRHPNQVVMRILSQNGDDRLVWDRTVKEQVKEAAKKFHDLLSKGYQAFVAKIDGRKGHKIDMFDHRLEEIIMVPAAKVFPG